MAVSSVEAYFSAHPEWEEELRELREILLATELEETLKWGAPTYTLEGKNVVGLAAFKNHCALWFFNGALLKNDRLLQNAQSGKTKAMRQARFVKGQEIPVAEVKICVQEAIRNQKEGKEIKAIQRTQEVEIPEDLQNFLDQDSALQKAFESLTPGRKREYCTYIQEAKRESTRNSRLDKIAPMIRQGKGLYDRYMNC